MPKTAYLILFLLVIPDVAMTANVQDVLINEIAWMGTANSANDEWIELFNATSAPIELSGWTLASPDGKLKISLKKNILPGSFYLLERTDDSTVSTITADLIYSGSLNNNGLDLGLYDNTNTLVDRADFASKWPAGNNTTKQTMERGKNLVWQTSDQPHGTPGAQNSPGAIENVQTLKEPAVESKGTATPVIEGTYPEGIFINEVLPAPEGPDETNEWIELYNQGDADVNLERWKVKDTKGGTTTYIFSNSASIVSKGYLILRRPETKITLNNDEDSLSLIFPNGQIADSMHYKEAVKNQSYNKTATGWQWSKSQTPGAKNIIATNHSNQPSLLKKEKSDNNTTSNNAAAVSEATLFDKNLTANNPWFLFIVAIVITIISGVAVLIFKLKFKNNVRT